MRAIKIVYYSGTGCVLQTVRVFERLLQEKGYLTWSESVNGKVSEVDRDYDMLILIFAVHAFNAPHAVYQWIGQSSKVHAIPCAVISVSGGGEITPNTACRVSCIRRLVKKGYEVNYEKMLVMPSNWIVATPEPIALELLHVLPDKVEHILQDLVCGRKHRTTPCVWDRGFSFLGKMEPPLAKLLGKGIKVSAACNGCGWCSQNCTLNNIKMVGSRPCFANKCHICLKCIYGCPNKALAFRFGNFIVIKEGFKVEALIKKSADVPGYDKDTIEKLCKGYSWSGIKKYLLEE